MFKNLFKKNTENLNMTEHSYVLKQILKGDYYGWCAGISRLKEKGLD